MRFITFIILFTFILNSCSKKNKTESDNHIDFNEIMEGDTLSFNHIPKNLNSWLGYYKKNDTLFTLSNFKASGVILHMSDLKESDTISLSRLKLKLLFEFSPDGLSYIDLWSYGHQDIPEKAWNSRSELAKKLRDGEADQQVVLGLNDGKRYELLFNGPSNLVEFAEWLNNDQFLISQISKEKNYFLFELFIFDIKEKLFTNYRLNNNVPFNLEGESFIEYWINETDKLIK